MQSPFALRQKLVSVGEMLAHRRFVAGTDGNLSARLADGRILVTPSGVAKGSMVADDLVVVDAAGTVVQGRGTPSTELAMHLEVYRRRPEVAAVIHSHPPYATAFAVAGEALPDDVLPEIVVFVGPIPLTDYAPPGTEAVPQSLEPTIDTASAWLLRNHGLLTCGRSVDEAVHRHEQVEHLATIVHHARMLGAVNQIPGEDFDRLNAMRQRLDATWDDAK